MNIFAIHLSPVKSAQELHDKHVVKMILESAQMLANALGDQYGNRLTPLLTKRFVTKNFHLIALSDRRLGLALFLEQYFRGRVFGWDCFGRLHFSTRGYSSHPCTVWARSSYPNLCWLVVHGLALCHEYRKRYKKQHCLQREYLRLSKLIPDLYEWKKVKSFARAMPSELKYSREISDTEAYQLYLKNHKSWYKQGWKRSSMPEWLQK